VTPLEERRSRRSRHRERIKLMKLLWDAIGSEFGGRHELYERNYTGNPHSAGSALCVLRDARFAGSSG
jgi:aromatic ring hydroxylase